MWNRGFQGWYFKHQNETDTIAFIPGRAKDGAFVQLLSDHGSRQFNVPDLTVEHGIIRAGNCRFSPQGCEVDLPGITGELRYHALTPPRFDMMGPFRFFPMECRHGVISMAHTLNGILTIDGAALCFDGGTGYIETDSGISFPKSYLWLQCNAFSQSCSVMLSIAEIPFCGIHFTGCICAIVFKGREYRLATYCGVRILAAQPHHIRLSQGRLLLDVEISPDDAGHQLAAPRGGRMTDLIRESHGASIFCRLWESGKPVLALHSDRASYENVPPQG